MKLTIDGYLDSDPDLEVGAFLTLERADGRSIWRQRLQVTRKLKHGYILVPCDDAKPYDEVHIRDLVKKRKAK